MIRIRSGLLVAAGLLFVLTISAAATGSAPQQGETAYLPLIHRPWTGPPGWVKAYQLISLLDVAPVQDGFVAAGRHNAESYPGAVLRTDGAGQVLWLRLHQLGESGAMQRVHPVADGSITAVGLSPTYEIVALANYGPDGALRWQQSVEVAGITRVGSEMTADGHYLIHGGGADGPFIWLLDPDGSVVWQQGFGNAANLAIQDIAPIPGHGFYAVGRTTYAGAGNWDGWVARFDDNGTAVWQRVVGTASADYLRAAAPTGAGGVIAAGSVVDADAGSDGWVVSLDGSGTLRWSRAYEYLGSDGFEDLLATSGGDYILAGGSVAPDTLPPEGWLARIAEGGAILWQRGIGPDWPAVGPVRQVGGGGFVMSGAGFGGPGLLFRLNEDGYAPRCPLVHYASGTAVDWPVSSDPFPYGTGPAAYAPGGSWFTRDGTVDVTPRCPLSNSRALCAP